MNFPKLLSKAWATLGLKNNIPEDRTSSISDELATYDDGFPSITMTPISLGGKAPSGKDMNGILHEITAHIVHQNKGGQYVFNSQFAETIGGYEKGAVLISNDFTQFFVSLVDDNKVDFNSVSDHSDHWAVIATTNINQLVKPKTITAGTTNSVDKNGHSHEIEKASTTKSGITKLNSATDSASESEAATPKAIKILKDLINSLTRNLDNYIPNSKKSDAFDSNSSDMVATSKAVRKLYDWCYQQLASKAGEHHSHMANDITDFADNIVKLFSHSLNETGWSKLPNGLIEQWGKVTLNQGIGTSIDTPVVFPVSFSREVFNVVVSYAVMTDKRVTQDPVLSALSTTGMTIRQQADRNVIVYWRAIGI